MADAPDCTIPCPRCLACLDDKPEHGNCPICGVGYTKRHLRKLRVKHGCARCGYDLSGLSRTGICPECGKPFKLYGPSSNTRLLQGQPISDISRPSPLVCAIPPALAATAGVLFQFTHPAAPIVLAALAVPTAVYALIAIVWYTFAKRELPTSHDTNSTKTDYILIALGMFNALVLLLFVGTCCSPVLFPNF